MNDPNLLYREQLLALSKDPAHKAELEEEPGTLRGRNPLCGDDVLISLEKARFDGYACALCTASSELLCRTIENLSPEETASAVKRIGLLLREPADPQWETDPDLEALKPLLTVHQFPARLECVLLPWRTASSGG
jgi:nitrogen fixation NifU-like protein